jgi:hypothetical protein
MLSAFLFLLLDFQFILSESLENAGEDELNNEEGRTQRSANTGFIQHAGFYGLWIHGFMQPIQYQYVGYINDESSPSPLSPVPHSLRNVGILKPKRSEKSNRSTINENLPKKETRSDLHHEVHKISKGRSSEKFCQHEV